MTPITDPELLAKLNRAAPVDDPRLLAQLRFDIDFTAKPAEVRAGIQKLAPEDRGDAMKAWARAHADKTRGAANPTAMTIADKMLQGIQGTPIGSFADEATAGIGSLLNTVTGGMVGRPYDEGKAFYQAEQEAADKASTKLGSLPVVGDITTGSLAKFTGGLMTAPMAPTLRVAQGTTMLPAAANAAATGAAYGGLYGAGEGESLGERGLNTAIGGGLGAGLGGLLAPVARGVANAYEGVRNGIRPLPPEIAGMNRTAVGKLAQSADDDGLLGTYPRQAGELGRDGMLADMGRNLRMDAARIARNPGEGATTVMNALNQRKEGAPMRIRMDVDRALGPAENMPETVRNIRQKANAQAQPHYDAYYNSPMLDTPAVEAVLQRAEASGALARARRMVATQGHDPDAPENLPRLLDQIKRSSDDMASAARQTGEHEAHMVYSDLSRQIRGAADRASGQPHYADARRISGEGQAFEEAAELGATAFSKALSPDQMAMDRGRLSPFATQAYDAAGRNQVRQTMGNAATQWGPNGDSAARTQLGSENAYKKLAIIAGPQRANMLVNRLDAETGFERTRVLANENSVTSTMQAAAKKWPTADAAETSRALGQKSLPGIALQGTYWIGNVLSGGAINEARMRTAADAAHMLTRQGVARDEIARGLLAYANRRNLTGASRDRIEDFIRALGAGARSSVVDGATNPSVP